LNPIDRGLPVLPRTGLNSTQLVRFLAGLEIAAGAASKQTFAERLSLWLDWTDAIALAGVLGGEAAATAGTAQPAAPGRARAVIREFERLRAHWVLAIDKDPAWAGSAAGAPEPDLPAFRRAYLEQQRAMTAAITALRARVRAALTELDPALGRLAALDAVLERTLAARERHLLATVPEWLERHFEAAPQPRQIQGALLAELDLRLQPVEGMIEALGEHAARQATTEATRQT
jgi:hypothetical protein